jgi:hypothetical protein
LCPTFGVHYTDPHFQEILVLDHVEEKTLRGVGLCYRSLKLTRDADGVLLVEFHSEGGPFRFTAQDHTEFVDAFYRIAQDRANKIVILSGAGGGVHP